MLDPVIVTLTQGRVAVIDVEDLTLVAPFSWMCAKQRTGKEYAIRSVDGMPMHRLIMGVQKGDPRDVDHEDGNGLDNRKFNLRVCSRSKNTMNRLMARTKTSSKSKGVYGRPSGAGIFIAARTRWRVVITVEGRRLNLGTFDSETEAAAAYDEAAKLHFKEFAVLNSQPRSFRYHSNYDLLVVGLSAGLI